MILALFLNFGSLHALTLADRPLSLIQDSWVQYVERSSGRNHNKSTSYLQRNYTSGLGSVEISQHLSLTTLSLQDARVLDNGMKTTKPELCI